MNRKLLAACISVIFLGNAALAQTPNKVKLDSLFNRLAEKNKGMGSVAIAKRGNVVYTKAIGYSSYKDKEAATVKTRYRIGSISKMFTTAIIFQLIEEHKLSLTTPLSTYFPQIPNAKSITIAMMLQHHSGLHSFTDDSDYLKWNVKPKTHAEIVSVIAAGKPEFEPGTKGAYSNSNFVLLGYIAEKICGKPYDKILSERITARIGLKDTYYGGKTNIKKNESYSYTYTGDWELQPETDMSIPGGAGSIVSTPSDLTRFVYALFTCKLVSAASLDKMKDITDGYGMGLFRFPFGQRSAYGHTGGIDGYGSMLGYFPDDSVAVVYCGNGQEYPINDIMIGVLSIYYNIPYTIPEFKTYAVGAADMDAYTGTYASKDIPLKVTIRREKNGLVAQATGQSSFPLEPVEKDKFRFEQAGVEMDFDPAQKSMVLRQGGATFSFTRE